MHTTLHSLFQRLHKHCLLYELFFSSLKQIVWFIDPVSEQASTSVPGLQKGEDRTVRLLIENYVNNNNIIIILYLPSAVFIAQVLVGPSKQLKQIFQIEHNIVKNPNWPEANPVGYLQAWPRIWTRGYRETNPGSGQSGTQTRDRWIASPTRWPLGHAASTFILNTSSRKGKQQRKIFQKIADRLNETSTVKVSGDQSLRKWLKLEGKFKEIEDNNNLTGWAKKSWKIYEDLEDAMGDSLKVNPAYTYDLADGTPPSSLNEHNSESDEDSDAEDDETGSTTKRVKTRKSRARRGVILLPQRCFPFCTLTQRRRRKWKKKNLICSGQWSRKRKRF